MLFLCWRSSSALGCEIPCANLADCFTRRKKKKKSHSSSDRAKVDTEIAQKDKEQEVERPAGRQMTEAERRFEETQKKRVSGRSALYLTPRPTGCSVRGDPVLTALQREERASKNAKMSHKDRVQELNQKLDSLRYVVS